MASWIVAYVILRIYQKFFLKALKAEKDIYYYLIIFYLLRISQCIGIDFHHFSKSKHFTKNYLLNNFKNDPDIESYLRDDIYMHFAKRSFLFNINLFPSILILILYIPGLLRLPK